MALLVASSSRASVEAADHRVQACELTEDRRLGLGALAHLLAHRLAAADALVGRRRPEPERGRDPREDLVVLMPIPCPPRMCGRALPRRGGRLGAGLVPIQPRLEPPCAAQAEIVPVALEDRDHPGRRPRGLLQPALLDVQEPEELLLDEHVRRRALIVRGGSQPLRLVEHAPGLGQPAAFDQRGAELGEQHRPPRIVGGKQPGNPLEQADRRGQVAADERPPSRRLEPLGRPGGERRRRASRAIRARRGTG